MTGLPVLAEAVSGIVRHESPIADLLVAINEHQQLKQNQAAVDAWVALFEVNLYDTLSSIAHMDAAALKSAAPIVPSRVLDYLTACIALVTGGTGTPSTEPRRKWPAGALAHQSETKGCVSTETSVSNKRVHHQTAPVRAASAGSSCEGAVPRVCQLPVEDPRTSPATPQPPTAVVRRPTGQSLNLWLCAQLRRAGYYLKECKDSRQFNYIRSERTLKEYPTPILTLEDLNTFIDQVREEQGGGQKLSRPVCEELRLLVDGTIADLVDAKQKEKPAAPAATSSATAAKDRAEVARPIRGAGKQMPVCNKEDLIQACELRRDCARAQEDAASFCRWAEACLLLKGCGQIRKTADIQKYAGSADKAAYKPRLHNSVAITLTKIFEGRELTQPEGLTTVARTAGSKPDIPPTCLDYQSVRAALLLAMWKLTENGMPDICKDDIIQEARPHTTKSFEPAPGTHFSAWNEIDILERVGLIQRQRRVAPLTHVFRLTDCGKVWGSYVQQDYSQRDLTDGGRYAGQAADLQPLTRTDLASATVGLVGADVAARSAFKRAASSRSVGEVSHRSTASSIGSGGGGKSLEQHRRKMRAREMLRKNPLCVAELQRQDGDDNMTCLGARVHSDTRKTFCFQVELACVHRKIISATCSCEDSEKRPNLFCKHVWATFMAEHDPNVQQQRMLAEQHFKASHELSSPTSCSRGRGAGRGRGQKRKCGPSAAVQGSDATKRRLVATPMQRSRLPVAEIPSSFLSAPDVCPRQGMSFPGRGKVLGSLVPDSRPSNINAARSSLLENLESSSSTVTAKSSKDHGLEISGASISPNMILEGLQLVVDCRERTRNQAFMALYSSIECAMTNFQLKGLKCTVSQEKLPLADYLWRNQQGEFLQHMAVERKTMRDLVARSGSNVHLSQCKRLQCSGFDQVVFLLEGCERSVASPVHHLDDPTITDVATLWEFMIGKQLDGVSFVQTRDEKASAQWLAAVSVSLATVQGPNDAPAVILKRSPESTWPTEDAIRERTGKALTDAGGDVDLATALLSVRFDLDVESAASAVQVLAGTRHSDPNHHVFISCELVKPTCGLGAVRVHAAKLDTTASYCFHAIEVQGSALVELALTVIEEVRDEGGGGPGRGADCTSCSKMWGQAVFLADCVAQEATKESELCMQLLFIVGIEDAEKDAFKMRAHLGQRFSELLLLSQVALLQRFPAVKACRSSREAENYLKALRTLVSKRCDRVMAHGQGNICEVIEDSLE